MRPAHELALLVLGTGLVMLTPSTAIARHRARLDPTEPIFTQRSFIQKDLELGVSVEHGQGDDTVGLTAGAAWVFANRLEVDLEIPWAIRLPDRGPTVADLDDVAVAGQLLLCCGPNGPLDYLSVRGEVDAPSGNR